MIWFRDPSLRYYPNPSVPAAAVQSLTRNKRHVAERRQFVVDSHHALGGNDDYFYEDESSPDENVHAGNDDRRSSKVKVNLLDVFETPSLQPLPVSDPSFALPVVHEDPHFRPDYALVQFKRPV